MTILIVSIKIVLKKSKFVMDWKQRFKIIGKILQKELQERGLKLTYETASKYLETSTATYGRWKAGKTIPNGIELERIAKKLNLSPKWLLFAEGKPKGHEEPSCEGEPKEYEVPICDRCKKVSFFQEELRVSQSKNIALLEKLAESRDNPHPEKGIAHISANAAHLSQGETE
jgi:transcriptional regulator with XRE-family HTH domain